MIYNILTLLSVSSEPGRRNWLIYAYIAQQAKVLTGLEPKSPFLHKTPLWQSCGGAVRFVDLAGVAGENPGRLEISGSMVKIKSKSQLPDLMSLPTIPAKGQTAPRAGATAGWERATRCLSLGISRELGRTLPTAGFCNGHSSHIAQTTAGAAAWGRGPQENELRPSRAAWDTGGVWFSAHKPDESYRTFSMSVISDYNTLHFGCVCASFVFIFHGHSSSGDLHPWTPAESEFKAWWLEYSQIDN